jgi:hypothetical protein
MPAPSFILSMVFKAKICGHTGKIFSAGNSCRDSNFSVVPLDYNSFITACSAIYPESLTSSLDLQETVGFNFVLLSAAEEV